MQSSYDTQNAVIASLTIQYFEYSQCKIITVHNVNHLQFPFDVHMYPALCTVCVLQALGGGRRVTQRQCPVMALISLRLVISEIGGAEDVIVHLSAPGMSNISVKEPPADTPSEQVRYCMDILYI